MFKPGDRVQLHPATDAWMRGDRYGEIVRKARRASVPKTPRWYVKLDKSGRVVKFAEASLEHVY